MIVVSPCSGHGFKFAPAIGDIAAAMAMDDRAGGGHAFRFGRFSLTAD